ncbi:histidine acid phosphatase [Tritrichomonas foetus]|uniref:Histidine acid phosphatase n=1 Tax=Tritrichomonas foetus TaxID=1144522 RepID=A0A1J4KHY3_9EUKA|nr:histidine acid phosphatase [Tritrichomonas foetus]|eukprot:OHT10819.1 histidine acid phosphatase [Tritrichomonas foetus]
MVYNMTCVAPLALPPMLNLTLLSVFTFLRHGERTPVDRWMPKNDSREIWICDNDEALSPQTQTFNRPGSPFRRYRSVLDSKTIPFPKNCAKGQLTVEGMAQLGRLGKFFREELIEKRKFLPDYFDPNLIDFRASYSDRAIRSLISYAHGLFPEDDPNEIITILTGTKSGREPLNPDPYSCQELQDAYAEFIETDEFKSRRDRALKLQKPLYDEIGLPPDDLNWQWLGDWLYSYYCSVDNKHLVPSSVTDEMFEVAMDDTAYYSNGFFDKYRDIPAGPIFRYLLESIDARISGEDSKKLTVFSGHDTTIAAITAFFGHANLKGIAPYRSHLSVELYDAADPVVRFSLNGEVITVDGQETVTLSRLKRMTTQSVQKCNYY